MKTYDVVVVGGGAAGLSAALVLLRARRTVVLVDAGTPRNATAARMHGFLSRDGMPLHDLVAVGRSEVSGYGGRLIDDTVVGVELGFHVRLANGSPLSARRVLVATGLRDQLPDIPGVAERWGRDLLHCPYCHGYEVRDQPLGVLRGTPEAGQHALVVRQWSPDVTLFPHTYALTAEQRQQPTARGIRIVEGTVSRLVIDNDQLRGVEPDSTVISRTAVFVRPRFVPNSDLLTGLGCEVDVVHDPTGRTTVAGVWVAGNAADPRAQVITAARKDQPQRWPSMQTWLMRTSNAPLRTTVPVLGRPRRLYLNTASLSNHPGKPPLITDDDQLTNIDRLAWHQHGNQSANEEIRAGDGGPDHGVRQVRQLADRRTTLSESEASLAELTAKIELDRHLPEIPNYVHNAKRAA
jgi:thioredoxin reductase